MSNEVLLNQYERSSRLFQLADRLTMSKSQHLDLKNLHGSSPAFVIAAIFNHPVTSQLNHLVVFEDAETAAYFHNSLENLTRALISFYFPSSFNLLLRTEALTRLSGGGNRKSSSAIRKPS
jgi:transcription-repair coupling factor (superfamily II helicase)